MKNKYFYPIFKLKIKPWLKYWLIKKTEFKGKLSEILSGFSFNLQNTLRQKFVKFDIQGHSEQDGEPSPENEVPIESAGDNGSITEKIVNKNWFDKNTVETGKYINNNTGAIASNNNYDASDFIYVKGVENIKITTSSVTANWGAFYDKNKHYISGISGYSNSISVPSNAYYVRFTLEQSDLNNVQLELGSTATPYVEHEEQTYTIYTQQPFRSIGDVRDRFVKVNGVWNEEHLKYFRVTKEMIKSTGVYGVNTWVIEPPTQVIYIQNTLLCKCTHFIGVAYENRGSGGNNIIYPIPAGNRIEFRNTEFSTRELFEEFLDNNEVYVEYVPVEPTYLPCTPEQIQQLENKPSTYEEQTNIYSEDEVAPFLQIQYWESDTNG